MTQHHALRQGLLETGMILLTEDEYADLNRGLRYARGDYRGPSRRPESSWQATKAMLDLLRRQALT